MQAKNVLVRIWTKRGPPWLHLNMIYNGDWKFAHHRVLTECFLTCFAADASCVSMMQKQKHAWSKKNKNLIIAYNNLWDFSKCARDFKNNIPMKNTNWKNTGKILFVAKIRGIYIEKPSALLPAAKTVCTSPCTAFKGQLFLPARILLRVSGFYFKNTSTVLLLKNE